MAKAWDRGNAQGLWLLMWSVDDRLKGSITHITLNIYILYIHFCHMYKWSVQMIFRKLSQGIDLFPGIVYQLHTLYKKYC